MTNLGANDPIVFTLLTEAAVIAAVSVAIVLTLVFRAGSRALSKRG